MDGVADRADVGSGPVGARQQLQQRRRRAARAILIADAMGRRACRSDARAATRPCADQADVRTSRPLHMNLAPDPTRRRAVVKPLQPRRSHPDELCARHTGSSETAPAAAPVGKVLFGEHCRHLPLGAAVDALVASVLPSDRDMPAPLPGSRTSCPSAVSFAHGRHHFRPALAIRSRTLHGNAVTP